jgi:hypothetical protein
MGLLALTIVVLLTCAPLAAHHWASASFDATRPFTITGVVTKFAWTNPHVALHLDVRDAQTGAVVPWTMDMASPSSLTRLGWSKNAVKPSDTIVVDGIPSRDGSPVGYAYAVTITATGRRLAAAPPKEH